MKTPPLIPFVLLMLLCTGCVPILIHAGVEADSRQSAAYAAYLDNMRQTNTQREIAGLPQLEVQSRKAWVKTLKADAPTK